MATVATFAERAPNNLRSDKWIEGKCCSLSMVIRALKSKVHNGTAGKNRQRFTMMDRHDTCNSQYLVEATKGGVSKELARFQLQTALIILRFLRRSQWTGNIEHSKVKHLVDFIVQIQMTRSMR
eukprot:4039048-Karenia_brevis.AAC.1